MTQFEFRANSLAAVGFDPASGEVIILGEHDGREERLRFAFPGDDIPRLMLLLSKAYAENFTGVPGRAIAVDSIQCLPARAEGAIPLRFDLAGEVPVTFAMPRAVSVQLRDELTALLE